MQDKPKLERKRLIGLFLFGGLFFLSLIVFSTFPATVGRIYNQTTITSDGIKIVFDVYDPLGENVPKTAIIIGHGVMVNKEFMKLLAIDLASSGFLVVAFDFRSHGRSGGDFNFLLENIDLHNIDLVDLAKLLPGDVIARDICAIKNYLAGRGDVNMSNLGYIGYSMGGGAGFAQLFEDNDFNAMVGLAPVPDFQRTNLTNPRNLLIVFGKYDEGVPYSGILKVMENKTGHAVNAAEIESEIAQKSYWEWSGGSFTAGSAARLYMDPAGEHLLAAWNFNFIREIKQWMLKALKNVALPAPAFTYGPLVTALFLEVVGGMGVFFLAAGPIINRFGKKKDNLVIPEKYFIEVPEKTLIQGIFVKIIIFSFPCMLLIFPLYFAPLIITAFEIMFIFGPSVATLLYLRKLTNKELGFRQLYRSLITGTQTRNILVGLGLGGLFYGILELSIGQIFSFMPSIWKWPWVPLYFVFGLFSYANFIMYFQGVLQEKVQRAGRSFWKIGIQSYLMMVGYSVFILLTPCVIIQNYFILMFFIPMVFLLLAASFIGSFFYTRNKDLVIPILTITLPITIMFVTLSLIINIWVIFL